MATLMASAAPGSVVEPPGSVIAAPANGHINQPFVALASGSSAPIQAEQFQPTAQAEPANVQSGNQWKLAPQTQAVQTGLETSSTIAAPNLPVYLPAPTAPTTYLTIDSNLGFAESGAFLDDSNQPVEPSPEDENMIVVTGPDRASPIDPLSEVNAEVFEIGQDFDRALVAPVANAYKQALPKPVRSGLRNFLNNLAEPVVFLNYLLQLKPGKAFETLGRFAINSTVGIGGIVDVAKDEPFNLPHRTNGFANTLGYYGVESGSYLYLPIIGATTVRDLVGDGLDLAVLPTAIGRPFNRTVYTAPAGVLRALDRRIERDDEIREVQEESNDPYVAARDRYLEMRQTEIDILRGKIPDPLSRKNKPNLPQETKKEPAFQHETAQLWYLNQ